ncbi:geranylgeranyl reductase family protein [Sagittula sp. S175]|uniref:NAD(P)/FAD-dependent oxidoreductase n=1 Tax=Sagittula sp. S175 TaxID=3415129 RepID=UPI003C7A8F13
MTPTDSGGATRSFDLIVIGAGPAGAACARTAAKNGLKTALVDKKRFPRDKLCGGGLTGRAIGHHDRIFGKPLPDIPFERRDNFEFHAFGENLDTGSDSPPIHLAMRRDLDAWLLQQAISAGAEDFTGQPGTLDPDSPALDLPGLRLTAPLIVAADGVSSPTAKLLFGEAFDRDQIGFALEVERPGDASNVPLRIDFGAADWGYGWQFPKTCGTTIGVGGVMRRNADMKASLAGYLRTLGVTEELKIKGQFLPFGGFRETPGKGRVLLAGDAAGLVDPITGEGIAHALHSGELAALAVVEALHAQNPDTALSRYTAALRPIHSGLKQARLLRHVMFREALRPTFIRSFKRSRTLKREYLRLLAGQTEYDAIMKGMALRLPSFVWRALRGR